jgi:manganese/iron transport system substrate-binding protein
LRVLDSWIREQFNVIPIEKRVLVTSHDAFNYFAQEFGFKNAAPVGWSTGAELGAGMTPERRKQVVDSIRRFGVKAVFVETSVNPKLVREIARDAGVRIGGQLYSDSMGEAGTAGETYIGMMRENVLTILHGLK